VLLWPFDFKKIQENQTFKKVRNYVSRFFEVKAASKIHPTSTTLSSVEIRPPAYPGISNKGQKILITSLLMT